MFFSKKKEKILSPIDGVVIPLCEVKDPVFSQGLVGNGCAVVPSKDCRKVCSPVDGIIVVLPESKHAFGVRTQRGNEYLIHVGIDTVNLKGEGFLAIKKEGDKVKPGECVLTLENTLFEKGYDLTTMVVCTSKSGGDISSIHSGGIEQGGVLFEL